MSVDVERLAFHEAGHVVAALQLGRDFEYVTIEFDGDVPAHTQFLAPPKTLASPLWAERRDAIEVEIMVTLAGTVIEELMWPTTPAKFGKQDLESAHQLALEMTDSDTECAAYLKWLSERTKNLLSTLSAWHDVGTVAKLLVERKMLTYEDIVGTLAA